MKKELIYYSILTITIALLLIFETNLFKDNATQVSKVINTETFEKLDIDLDCNIYVVLGDEQKVVFEGPANYLDKVETKLEDGVLKIFCKKQGLLANWLSPTPEADETVNIYVKLTDANQLIKPKKGNLISNETLQLMDRGNNELFSFGVDFRSLLKLIGDQLGYIRIR